jgi:predicted permease
MNLDDEIRDHIERETRDNIEHGMPPHEARAAALRAFGNVTRVAEQTREVWSIVWLDQLWQDVRYGVRMLRRNPGFTLVVVLTLALGIGMNTALFSIVNAVMLRPIGYPAPERLVWLGDYDPNVKRDHVFSLDFRDWRAHAQSYSAMAAFGYQQSAMGTPEGAANISGVVVAGDFWTITGAQAALGRLFGPGERDTIVLSWNLFEHAFSGDPGFVGKTIQLDGRAVTITGVLPKTFRLQLPMWWMVSQPQPVEAYLALPPDAQRSIQVVAALKPGVKKAQALAEIQVIEKSIIQADPVRRAHSVHPILHLDSLQDQLVGSARPALLVLFAAGAFVLAIAAVNIMNLLLARAAARRREIAIRASVGAGRTRVIRQLLTESLVLAMLGGAAGLGLARGALALAIRLSPNAVPRMEEATIDGWVLAFTLSVSAGAGIFFGAGPAIALWRRNLYRALKDGERTSAGSSGLRVRRLLVAGEFALAVVLLTGAGLMLKSFWLMNAHPPGFAPEHVLMMKARAAGPKYGNKQAQDAYLRELVSRIESAPQVEAAGLSLWILFGDAPAFPVDTSLTQRHTVRLNYASTGFMNAVGMRLAAGRWLTESDSDSNVMLNESLAREAFGNADPIGRVITVFHPSTVVGIVSDLKYSKLDAAAPAEAFLSYRQKPYLPGMTFDWAVRTVGNPSAVAADMRKLIAEIDPAQPVYGMKTLEGALSDSIAPRRFNLFVLTVFAATALLLALIGIYGVIAYSIAQRTHEIGIRMALGAQRGEVVGMIAREGMSIALAGMAAGLAAAAGLTRLMVALLYDVKPSDAPTFTVVAAALAVTAIVACWGTAFRAALVDPMAALRSE